MADLLRLKEETSFSRVLHALREAGPDGLSWEEIEEIARTKREVKMLPWFANMFDNVSIRRHSDRFTMTNWVDVIPQAMVIERARKSKPTPKRKGKKAQPVALAEPNRPDPEVDQQILIFPEAPPIPEPMEGFRKPPYYELMGQVLDSGRHVSIEGPPGIGKSTAFEQLAIERGKPLVNVGADVGLRKRDLVGSVELANGHTFIMVAEYAAAAIHGWWVKIDEVNGADPDALLFLNGQLAPPYAVQIGGRSYPIHKEFRLCVTYNAGLVGTKPLPESLKDRFFPFREKFPTRFRLKLMLVSNGMPEDAYYAEWLLSYAEKLWAHNEDGRTRYQLSTRRLYDAVMLIEQFGHTPDNAVKGAVINMVDNPLEVESLTNHFKNYQAMNPMPEPPVEATVIVIGGEDEQPGLQGSETPREEGGESGPEVQTSGLQE